MSAKKYASVWDALEDTPANAANMKVRADKSKRDHRPRKPPNWELPNPG
jgi:hypothetical protein